MRTTVSISDDLLDEAKRVALERKVALGDVIDDALRLALKTQAKAGPTAGEPVPFKTFGGSGVRPGVDLQDSGSLLEVMEDP
jgi:hypothetical protein